MSNFKNVQPLDDFNWDEFENGTNAGVSKTDLEKAYDETLNKVTEHQVVEGTVCLLYTSRRNLVQQSIYHIHLCLVVRELGLEHLLSNLNREFSHLSTNFADGLPIEPIFLPCQFHYFTVALDQLGVESV